jgi:hypothetical protein
MTSKAAQERIIEACEDAIAEAQGKRWRSVNSLLADAAAVASAMSSNPIPIGKVGKLDGSVRYSKSLEHGLKILSLFTAERPIWGVADTADKLSMARSTTHRYLISLVKLGQVEQTAHRKYRRIPA